MKDALWVSIISMDYLHDVAVCSDCKCNAKKSAFCSSTPVSHWQLQFNLILRWM